MEEKQSKFTYMAHICNLDGWTWMVHNIAVLLYSLEIMNAIYACLLRHSVKTVAVVIVTHPS